MLEELYRRHMEKQDEKEYQEIYDFVKNKEKKKYKSKIEKLRKEVQDAHRHLEEAQKKPKQRTVKLQTTDMTTKINRGIDACAVLFEDKEISAQPTFRQESLEKAISEKLDEIEHKAKLESRKKSYRRAT